MKQHICLKKRLHHALPILFSLVFGGAAGWLLVLYADARFSGLSLFSIAVLLFLLYLGFALQIILHEAGHLVCGLLSGYSSSSFRILSLMWVKLDGNIRCKRLHISGTAGQCLMSPPDMVDGHLPTVLYNLGGVAANLLSALVFSGVSYMLPAFPFLSSAFAMAAAAGFLLALTNGIPMRTSQISNDGLNALSLGKNPEAMRAFWIQMKVCEKISLGVRLRDMPDEWFVPASDEAMKNGIVVVPAVFACNRLMDAQQFDEAERMMRRLLGLQTGMAGLHRSLMLCDLLYIHLVTGQHGDIPAQLVSPQQKQFMKRMRQFPTVLRTQYAFALLHEHDTAKAERCLRLFERCAASYPCPGDIASERELMDTARAAAEASCR